MEKISIVILSGGKSRRMGTDKARLLIGGRTFVECLRDNFMNVRSEKEKSTDSLPECSEIFFSVRNKNDFPEVAMEHIEDEYPGCGPLAGIHSGLSHAKNDWLFVAACDTPFVTYRTIEELFMYTGEDCDAVIPIEPDGRCHVLCGFYHKKIFPVIDRELKNKNYRVNKILSGLRTRYVPVSQFTDYKKVFQNVNTPEAYQEVLR